MSAATLLARTEVLTPDTSNTETFDTVAAEAMAGLPNYSSQTGGRRDPGWRVYFEFLHPWPAQIVQLKNRDVLEPIRKQGDGLTDPRKIYHFAYFSDVADCEAFSFLLSK